ncbi:MAG: hypothetical protein JETT_3823 [Candidatus Jettenia ecosi]|uniref:Uncharacterized protein n=1 Tax=Candidatus Jettenia ecosi TaxID=2494326 RepID=A0A533Q5U3_9BACT|nr:MAG: hypothetical protein JETT_3823 [Candidatus Jettenia ecosi]
MSKCKDKKYPCDDCFSCQFCSDERCSMCLCSKHKARQLSVEEQIALYEALNKDTFK